MILSHDFTVITAGCCGASFAVPDESYERWHQTHVRWYCPHCGSRRHFIGETKEQKRIRDLEQRVAREQGRVVAERTRADNHRRRYRRMRERIQNGVCPCCNRTFTNLARHMATQHPKLPTTEKVRHLRHLYGMTQADLASEVGLYQGPSAVSRYETGRGLGKEAAERIERWVEDQLATTGADE